MLVNDFIDVFLIDIGVPDAFGINHQYRSFLATVQAAGLVDADLARAIQVKRLDAALGMFLRGLRTAIGAAWTPVFALVQAKKYMLLVIRLVSHGKNLIWGGRWKRRFNPE
jgi:hypothetical protein